MKHLEIKTNSSKTLRGYLHLPSNFNGKLVLMYHGFTGNKTEHGGHFRDLSRYLEIEGIASLRMDFSGNGESDGSFRDFTFDTMVSEANILLDYAIGIKGVKELILLGYSMGGALAGYIAGLRSADIDKLVLWSPAAKIAKIVRLRYEQTVKLANLDADYGNYPLSLAMYESAKKYDFLEGVSNFKKPVLIIQGGKDAVVSKEIAEEYNKLYENSELVIIDSAAHGYDRSNEKTELLFETHKFIRGSV